MKVVNFTANLTNKLYRFFEDYSDAIYSLDSVVRDEKKHNLLEGIIQSRGNYYIALENEEIEGIIGFKHLNFEAQILGIPCAGIGLLYAKGGYEKEMTTKNLLLKTFGEWANKNTIQFVSTKVESDDISSVHALEDDGFRMIESATIFRYDFKRLPLNLGQVQKNTIRFATATDFNAIENLAYESFKYDRFHKDARFDKKLASNLKRKWIENSCKNGNHVIFVADVDGEVGGFLTCHLPQGSSSWTDLIAVSDKFRGRSIGVELFYKAQEWFSTRCNVLYASTQISNIPSLNTHLRAGFKLHSNAFTFHKWLY